MHIHPTRGHALVIQVVIVLVVAGVVALPIFLYAYSRTQKTQRLLGEIVALVNESNGLRDRVEKAYERVARAHRHLAHSQNVKREYRDEFTRLYNRYFEAQKGVRSGDSPPTHEALLAIQRDFEDFRRRLQGHFQRIKVLQDLVDLAEIAVQNARAYQTCLRKVRDTAPYEKNGSILAQFEEADRQLGTKIHWVLSGIDQYPEDLRGKDTPLLIKAGIEQIRRITAEVDSLFSRIQGVDTVLMDRSGSGGGMTLARYLKDFQAMCRKQVIPPLPDR